MATKSPLDHNILTIADVQSLGRAQIDISDRYPTKFLTERDFSTGSCVPTGRVPAQQTEATAAFGRIDFQLKGTNPTWLELAVQPRKLADTNNLSLTFPGHSAKTSLYAGQNKSELKKLMNEAMGKNSIPPSA